MFPNVKFVLIFTYVKQPPALSSHFFVLPLCGCLKMLGLYLFTLVICHESFNMLSILYKLLLQKKFQTLATNYVFWDKKVKKQKQNKKNQT